jgi:uncharacterized protein with von Willebrand factor type A (vWA) domain
MITEKELLIKLEAAEKEIKSIRSKIVNLRSTLWEQESELLTSQLLREKLLRELKEVREQTYEPEDAARDEDIKRFKGVVKELMEKEEKKEK